MNDTGANLLIDGSNLLMAGMSANDVDYNFRGTYIGGVSTVISQIHNLIEKFNPKSATVLFDLGKSIHRSTIFPEYKGGRMKQLIDIELKVSKQKELIEQCTDSKERVELKKKLKTLLNYNDQKKRYAFKDLTMFNLMHLLPMMGVYVGTLPNTEADDIIYNMVNSSNKDIIIVSTDKDMLQMISPRVSVYRQITQQFVTSKNIKSMFGYEPKDVVPLKILEGDASDNIKGCSGVGAKLALQIIEETDATVESITAWAMKPENLLTKSGTPKKSTDNLLTFLESGQWELNRSIIDLSEGPKLPPLTDILYKPTINNTLLEKLMSDIGLFELDESELDYLEIAYSIQDMLNG